MAVNSKIYKEIRGKLDVVLSELNSLLKTYEENEVELSQSFISQFRNSDELEDFIYQLTSSLEDEETLN